MIKQSDKSNIIKALDEMAMEMTDAGYKFTPKVRKLYENAIKILQEDD